MTVSRRLSPALVSAMAVVSAVSPLAAQAVGNSAEFEAWRKVQAQDGRARSFHEVFAHVAAEGNTETAMVGGALPSGSLADFDAEEARLGKLPDDQLIAAMDKSLRSLSAILAGLSLGGMNTRITYYGQPTLPRVSTTYTLNDLHEHLGQLVAYARMNRIVPPWSRKSV